MRSAAPLLLLLPVIAPFVAPSSARAQYEDLQIEKLSGKLGYADGVTWVKDGYLVIADVLSKKLLRFDPGEKGRSIRDDDGGVQGLAADSLGRIYMCESLTRRVTRLDRRGKLETIAEQYQGKKLNSPNDITVRKDGIVFFTDPAFGGAQDHRDLEFHGIFRIDTKGNLEAIAQWKTRPNGIALTQDGKTLYVTDADRHAVVAFDLDKNGAASNERTVIKGIEGVPGGIRTDVQGRLYIAARNVDIYSPAGKHVFKIQVSEPATNCAFGQEDMESLFIATRKGLYRAQLHVKGATQY